MSFFISFMPASLLRSSPPVSKHTPLPTSGDPGRVGVAPGEVDQPRRPRAARADGMDQRIVLAQLVAFDDAHAHVVALGERLGRRGELGRPMSSAGVLTRSRTSDAALTVRSTVIAVGALGSPARRAGGRPCDSA
jgi:hypothetical protein